MTPIATMLTEHESRTLALEHGLPFVTLDRRTGLADDQATNALAAAMLPESVCRHFGLVAVAYHDGELVIAVSDPRDELARSVAQTLTGRELRFVVAPSEDVERALRRAFDGPDATDELDTVDAPDAAWEPGAWHERRVGDLLRAKGLVTEDELVAALEEHERTGSRLGDVLMHRGVIDESTLVVTLAEQLGYPAVDLTDFTPEPAAVAAIPEPVARRLGVMPLALGQSELHLAAAEPPSPETLEELGRHTDLALHVHLSPARQIGEVFRRVHGQAYVEAATGELLRRFPEDCANRVVSSAQKTVLIAVVVVYLILLALFPLPSLIGFIALSSVFYFAVSIYKFWLAYQSLEHEYTLQVDDDDLQVMDERTLETHTILVPLYKEAAVVPRLVDGIEGLDFPKSKLDVRLLCEEDDEETIEAIRALELPPHYHLVIVPDAQPKTKPKACNYGLLQAEGRFVVIYDAEDRPDADQLKLVQLAFARAESRVACIQCKLNYFNQEQNLLTRWFSAEYSMWFDLILPGLDRQDVPIPLGGTSNHFVTQALVDLGGWDPFNVTEDADLGIRLYKAGYHTAVVDSTTLEEANSQVGNWVRQRSRWIKGYIQTWLVHMRHPLRLLHDVGPKSFISFQLLIGGTFIFLLNPIYWLLTTIFFLTQAGFIRQLFPSLVFYASALLLFVGNFVFVYLNVAATAHRGYFRLAKFALLAPLYWGLMSLAAWKGFIQLFTNPFYWEKTEHGLDQPGSGA